MSEPRPAVGAPSRTGVRRSGDDYQDLVAWCAVLRAVQPNSGVIQVDMEINGVGNVDDVILRTAGGPDRYMQVKWATNAGDLVNTSYMTVRKTKGKSLLEKFHRSFRLLQRGAVSPVMELVTNRALDRHDPLLTLCDGRTDLLLPAARHIAAESDAGRRRTEWANHLGVSDDELLTVLEHLVFRTGRGISAEQERAEALMIGAGLRADQTALRLGTATVAAWVRGGRRSLSLEDISREIDGLDLRMTEPRAVMLVQAIARDPHPDDASIALDWVDMYEGDSAPTRRHPKSRSCWARMSTEIDEAVATLRDSGHRNILIRGAMRQATFFAVGARLAQVTGMTVTYAQSGTLWSSDSLRVDVARLNVTRVSINQGDELAVAVGVAVDPTEAVSRYLTEAGVPVRELLTLLPGGGPHDQAVAGPGQAVAFAQHLRNHVRHELEQRRVDRVHLFLAGPGGLALLSGHRWNRVAPTIVYEDLGPGRGYEAAFVVSA